MMSTKSILSTAALLLLLAPLTAHAQKMDAPKPTPIVNIVRPKPGMAKSGSKSQAALASKTATFATIAETDSKVKSATKAEDLTAAKTMIGKEATVIGTVAKVFAPGSNSVVLLNFAKNYRTALTAAVKASDFAAFPDLATLNGKKLLITAKIIDYKGQPEIELTKPDQIKIVK